MPRAFTMTMFYSRYREEFMSVASTLFTLLETQTKNILLRSSRLLHRCRRAIPTLFTTPTTQTSESIKLLQVVYDAGPLIALSQFLLTQSTTRRNGPHGNKFDQKFVQLCPFKGGLSHYLDYPSMRYGI